MILRCLRRWLGRGQVKTLSSLNAYALWANDYPPHAHNPLMHIEESTMLALLPDVKGKTALDLACGTGRYSRIMLARGAKSVIACDNALEMLHAGQTAPEFRYDRMPFFTGATTGAIPVKSGGVDVVVCGLAIGHVADLMPTLAEISRVLAVDGCALLSDFHPFLALTGRKRLFNAPDGQVYAVEHYTHLIASVFEGAKQVGLRVVAIQEPLLSIDGQEIPVVVVYKLEKT